MFKSLVAVAENIQLKAYTTDEISQDYVRQNTETQADSDKPATSHAKGARLSIS